MTALTLKNLAAHKMRLLSTAIAVLLGVAFMSGTLTFNDTLVSTFDDLVTDANAGVDGVVRAPSPVELGFGQSGVRIDPALVEEAGAVDGVDSAAPLVFGYAQVLGPGGDPVGEQDEKPAFGLNWVDVDAMNPYDLVAGKAPSGPGEIVIDRKTADTTGYGPGDAVTVLTRSAPEEFTISGIATFAGRDSAAGASAVLFEDTTALRLLSPDGRVDWVVLTAEAGVSPEDMVAAVRTALSDRGVEAVTGASLVAEGQDAFHDEIQPFKVFMLVFAFVALFVGSFIINNTFSITVAQRTKEMAMLRAIGASRPQVLRSVLAEALFVGVSASAAGLAVGVGVARGLVALMAQAGIELPNALVVTRSSMTLAIVLGVTVTVLSSILPARRASRVQPIAALRDVAVDRSATSRKRAASGAALASVGGIALFAGLGGSEIALVGLGAFLVLIAAAVLAPIFTRPVTAILGRPLAWTGISGEMATRNAQRSAKRTARTASALMIGVALVGFITVVGASMKSSFASALADEFRGTHVIDSGSFDGRGGISPELAATLRATSGIDTVSAARTAPAVVDGRATEFFSGYDSATIADLFDLGHIEGDLASLGSDGIAISKDRQESRGWDLGTTIRVGLPSGEHDFTVRAIFDNAERWVGPEFVSTEAFDRFLPAQADYRVYLAGDDDAIRAATAPYGSIDVLDRQQFSDSVGEDIDLFLGLVYALLALAIVISLFGVANTLALSVHERTRELGLLRAVGMSRRQVRATVRGEALTIGLFGTVLGIGIGVFFGWAAMQALAEVGFDVLTIPVTTLAVIATVAAAAAALAAGLPARRAARLDVLTALSAH